MKQKQVTPKANNTQDATAAKPIKYAPAVKPIAGTYNLYCVALVWQDNPGPEMSKLVSAAMDAASTYKQLSNSKLQFKVIPKIIKVDYKHLEKNLASAEKQAKESILRDTKEANNIFIFNNNRMREYSYGLNDEIHLSESDPQTVRHELGHCAPLKLGHSGKYENNTYDPFGDTTTMMGGYDSRSLTASQLYFLGWLPQNKVALHTRQQQAREYNIEKLSSKKVNNCVKVILIPRNDNSRLFLSMPKVNDKFIFALHLANGGSSQLITTFEQQSVYEGMTFKRIVNSNGGTSIRVSPTGTKVANHTS